MAEKQSVLYSAKGITCISQSSNKDIEKNSSKNQRYMQRKGLTDFYSKPNFVYNNYIWLEHHIYTQELHVKIFFTYFNNLTEKFYLWQLFNRCDNVWTKSCCYPWHTGPINLFNNLNMLILIKTFHILPKFVIRNYFLIFKS